MRLNSMMPAAKKRIGQLSLFARHADGNFSGPQGSPGRTAAAGLPATPSPAVAATTSHLPQLQPAADIISSRSEAAASARLPAPSRSARLFGTTQQSPPSQASPPHQYSQSMSKIRATASEQGSRSYSNKGGPWEDSTVDSIFDPIESKSVSERYRPQTLHGRQYSDITTRRVRPQEHARAYREGQSQQPAFIFDDNGELKVVNSPGSESFAAALNTSNSSPLLNERPPRQDDIYEDHRHNYESTPTKISMLRRTKLPHRDSRDAVKRNSFTERLTGYPPDVNADAMGMSPERSSESGDRLEQLRMEEIARRKQEAKRERELQAKRSTVFESLTPVEEPTFDNTRAAVAQSSEVNPESIKEDLTPNGTPRRVRGPGPEGRDERESQRQARQQLSQKLAALNDNPQDTVPAHGSRQPLAVQNNLLQDSAIARTNSRRHRDAAVKKRRHSLDYDDAELDAMSFSDLRKQAFDFDPQAAAVALQQTEGAPGGTIEEKLLHFKGKDGVLQHSFFTQLSVNEWDAAGDWFLDQFSGVMNKMKEARKEKRKIMSQYEDEISAREEAVRGKIEGIEHTLSELKQEGQTMMKGKDVEDLEF